MHKNAYCNYLPFPDGVAGVTGGAQKLGEVAYASFLDETYLADRKTTLRAYLAAHPEVLTTEPPESLRERYGG